jgi:hypothetical protein
VNGAELERARPRSAADDPRTLPKMFGVRSASPFAKTVVEDGRRTRHDATRGARIGWQVGKSSFETWAAMDVELRAREAR